MGAVHRRGPVVRAVRPVAGDVQRGDQAPTRRARAATAQTKRGGEKSMTNLLAIVISIVATNTSELKTNIVENAFAPVLNNYFVIRATPVTEKWVTTTVEKIERLQFHWLGSEEHTSDIQPIDY